MAPTTAVEETSTVVLKERRDTTRWLLATLSVLVFVALGLGLWLARHSLGLAHSGGSHAPMVMQSAASPPPPRGTPPCPDAPPAPGYPPLAPRFPPAFTAFDVSSAVVFDGLAALLPPAGLATFQDSFVRAMAAAAEVPEQRVTVLSVVNTTSESASPTTGRRLLDVTTGQLVVTSVVRLEEAEAARVFSEVLRTTPATVFDSGGFEAELGVGELGDITAVNVTVGSGERVEPPAYPPAYPLASCGLRQCRWLGDGWCDAGEANTAECGWDGGDCCNDTVPLFDCLEPGHVNFGRSAPRGLQLPAPTNPRYTAGEGREVSSADLVMNYNNYYEFTTSKTYVATVAGRHAAFFQGPWQITIDGLVEEAMTVDVAELLAMFHMEERVYRHRCVEAWSIVVPWVGFPLYKLLDKVKPLASARYVEFQTFYDESVSDNQRLYANSYPYPYIEGLSIEEARNELAFLSVGQFQQRMPPQSGAPIRLTVPWKYGFKSVKSLVRISFTDTRPVNFWQSLQSAEYGFWANVNPEVPHARWSQASERELVDSSGGGRIDTQLFNGYADQVSYLYDGVEGEALYM